MPEVLLTQMLQQVGPSSLGFALGNALSANTVERLLCRVLWAANLIPTPMVDYWETIQLDTTQKQAGFIEVCVFKVLFSGVQGIVRFGGRFHD